MFFNYPDYFVLELLDEKEKIEDKDDENKGNREEKFDSPMKLQE